ncbi:hypothetical protein TW95_gp1513 [Pandoravirus inopinatum]|uniref:Uncharacterized protein n=1 Tax=Pandoravirus inopinatum TaxID=1605721 RepID=A0A0B5JEP3_9VIRU|nr:hypothetical protein TW95_gp1513 [Pandoravirus inopinatum]AJF98247.1 hypothetical protein [Pandoravirus inopinatum]
MRQAEQDRVEWEQDGFLLPLTPAGSRCRDWHQASLAERGGQQREATTGAAACRIRVRIGLFVVVAVVGGAHVHEARSRDKRKRAGRARHPFFSPRGAIATVDPLCAARPLCAATKDNSCFFFFWE